MFSLAAPLSGCQTNPFQPVPICSNDAGDPIQVADPTTGIVPDQISGNDCNSVTIERAYYSDSEKQLIAMAEAVPSTVGDHWYSETKTAAVDTSDSAIPNLFIADAANGEALKYYIDRSTFFTQHHDQFGVISSLTYKATVSSQVPSYSLNGAVLTNVNVVSVTLEYSELFPTIELTLFIGLGPPGDAPTIHREVIFDKDGNLVGVTGDGMAEIAVID